MGLEVEDRGGSPNRRPKYQQLPMFMRAGELHDESFPKGDYDQALDGGTHNLFMYHKLYEASENGLVSSVRKHGVHTPVKVDWNKGGTLVDGHHRVAAANRVNPNMWLPVQSVDPGEYMGASGDMSISEYFRQNDNKKHDED